MPSALDDAKASPRFDGFDLVAQSSASINHLHCGRVLGAMGDGEEPDVDVEAIRGEIAEILAPVRGAFGRPDSRGDYANEADFKKLGRRGRDYEAAGYREAARTVYSVVAEGLESNRHLFNPHRGWHGSLREALLTRLDQLGEEGEEKSKAAGVDCL